MTEVPRPRLLVVLALVSFVYATIGVITSLSTFVTLTGSHDTFTSEVQKESSKIVVGKDAAGDAELGTIALRKAEALWSRRNVLLPLAGAELIVSVLILMGCTRTWRSPTRRSWGRSTWQFGCLLSLPCLGLSTMVEIAHVRDLSAAMADLHGALATQLHDGNLAQAVVWVRSAMTALYLLGVAAYLNGRRVRDFAGPDST